MNIKKLKQKKINDYLGDIEILPNLKRMGSNTRGKGKSPRTHVYKILINNSKYYKVQLHRSNKHVTRYFKTQKEAIELVNKLRKYEE